MCQIRGEEPSSWRQPGPRTTTIKCVPAWNRGPGVSAEATTGLITAAVLGGLTAPEGCRPSRPGRGPGGGGGGGVAGPGDFAPTLSSRSVPGQPLRVMRHGDRSVLRDRPFPASPPKSPGYSRGFPHIAKWCLSPPAGNTGDDGGHLALTRINGLPC